MHALHRHISEIFREAHFRMSAEDFSDSLILAFINLLSTISARFISAGLFSMRRRKSNTNIFKVSLTEYHMDNDR